MEFLKTEKWYGFRKTVNPSEEKTVKSMQLKTWVFRQIRVQEFHFRTGGGGIY